MSNRRTFDVELAKLKQDILRMASMVEQNIYKAMDALLKQDPVIAREIVTEDNVIDQLGYEIENNYIRLIATQQPMAQDLRVIMTGIKTLTNLERMGDYAVNISRAAMCVCGRMPAEPLEKIPRMARIAQQMVKDGLDAYVYGDTEKARRVCLLDDDVDELYLLTFQDLISYMQAHPHSIPYVSYLLLVAYYLERLADRATNIGEDVVYMVTGERQGLS